MKEYIFKQGSINELDLIKPLWEKLNQLHSNLSPNFKSWFLSKTWDLRKSDLITKSKEIHINYVTNRTNIIIAYCISTIDNKDETMGEIDSIYIEDTYRKNGIGKRLMNDALDWLIGKGTTLQKLDVAAGNEKALDFYKQFNFYPTNIILQRK